MSSSKYMSPGIGGPLLLSAPDANPKTSWWTVGAEGDREAFMRAQSAEQERMRLSRFGQLMMQPTSSV